MTAALVIVALAALASSGATVTLALVNHAQAKALSAANDRYLDCKATADLAMSNLAAAKDTNDADEKMLANQRVAIADLTDRLKVAEARAVHGLSTDELRDVVNGVSPHGDGQGSVPGAGAGLAAAAVPVDAAAGAAARPGGGVR